MSTKVQEFFPNEGSSIWVESAATSGGDPAVKLEINDEAVLTESECYDLVRHLMLVLEHSRESWHEKQSRDGDAGPHLTAVEVVA